MPDQSASELFSSHLDLLVSDRERWRALFAPDAIYEFPYNPSIGAPQRFEGIEQIAAHMEAIVSGFEQLRFRNLKFYSLAEPDSGFVEFEGEGTRKSTGLRYEQMYVCFFRTVGGKIVFVREYWNPLAVIAAFGLGKIVLNKG